MPTHRWVIPVHLARTCWFILVDTDGLSLPATREDDVVVAVVFGEVAVHRVCVFEQVGTWDDMIGG